MSIKVSGGGGGGGGPFPGQSDGACIETSQLLVADQSQVAISLDTSGPAQIAWLEGFTITDDNLHLVIPRKGRYLVTCNSVISQHATEWNAASIGAKTNGSHKFGMADDTVVAIPPTSVLDTGGLGVTSQFVSYVEADAGNILTFYGVQWSTGVAAARLEDVYCQVQYVAPATSF